MKVLEPDWTVPQRQSAAAIFIVMVKAFVDVLKFLWPVLLVTILQSSGKRWELVFLIVPVLSIGIALVEVYFFRFSISNNELVIRQGSLVRKIIVLPLDKIQAVHIDRTWVHKLFSVAQISFDSAGTEKMEIKINAISLQKAEALREFISQSSDSDTSVEQSPASEETLVTLGLKDLLKLSISSNHLEAFFILLAFALSALDNIETIIGRKVSGFWENVIQFAMGSSGKMILFVIVALLLVSITISTVRILLIYLDFRLTRNEQGFRIKTGLINLKEKLVPFRKVQFISWRANWLRTRMNLFLLNFHSASSDLQREKLQIKVPITQKEFIPVLVSSYYPLLEVKTMNSLRIQSVYISRRILFAGIIPAALLFGIAYPFFGVNALWLFLIVPFTALGSSLFQKRFRLWANDHAIQIIKSVYGIDELILKWKHVQKIRVQQSLFQRRKGLATVKIYTAGGRITIPYIKHPEAMALMNFGLYKVESSNDPWM